MEKPTVFAIKVPPGVKRITVTWRDGGHVNETYVLGSDGWEFSHGLRATSEYGAGGGGGSTPLPSPPEGIDYEALSAEVSARYPKIMKRLAE